MQKIILKIFISVLALVIGFIYFMLNFGTGCACIPAEDYEQVNID